MLKLLHSADWHLDAPLAGLSPVQRNILIGFQQTIPQRIAQLCQKERCQALLLSGDLFDRAPSRDTLEAVWHALGSLSIPVLIAPGNHDFYQESSPYAQAGWPENIHIFTTPQLEPLVLPELDCCFYGAGYQSMDCPGLLAGFHARATQRYAVGLFHGDPTQRSSPYSPVTAEQVQESGLDYVALGHLHQKGSFQAGSTLCAWPGCPMGQGFDETGTKGVLLVTLEAQAQTIFLPLGLPEFHDWVLDVQQTPLGEVERKLNAKGQNDSFRITLTGEAEPADMAALKKSLSARTNLILRDQTVSPGAVWATMEQDNLEGLYFRLLHDAADPALGRLAAELSRRILDGWEVQLP